MDARVKNAGSSAWPANSRAALNNIEARASDGAIFVEWTDFELSYAELLDGIRRCCGVFDSRNLKPGDRVLILCRREREAIITFLAAMLDGLVPVMLTPDTPAMRAKPITELTEAALVVTDQERLAEEDWLRSFSTVGVTDREGGISNLLGMFWRAEKAAPTLDRLMAASPGRPPRCASMPDDLAYILFTSGTTSAPKGVMITHDNLFTHLETISRVFGYNSESRIFNGMILAHGDGLVQGPLLSLFNGCRMVRPEPFSAQTIESFLNMVRARRATHFLTVPAVYALIDRYAEHDDYFAADEFAAMISVAAKLETNLWTSLEAKFKRPVSNMYGLTETTTCGLYAGPYPDMGPVGTIGKPIDIDVRLVRADGTDVPDGEPGEIWLRGSCVSPGYYKAPAETAERYSGEWLKTADVAIKRPDGAYEMVGRLKTIIMYGGMLIRPEEIDEVLLRHSAVVEAATVGIANEDFGEIPVSAVVLDSVADENDLTAHCLTHLESKKVPRRIIALASIPRGDAGKAQLNALRESLKAQMKAPQSQVNDADIETAVIEVAAATFRMPRAELSLESSPETVVMWDSFAHIALIHNVEARLRVQLPTAEVMTIDSLRKLADAVRRQK